MSKKHRKSKKHKYKKRTDPFYSKRNLEHLRRGIEALNAGKGTEHDLIEEQEVYENTQKVER